MKKALIFILLFGMFFVCGCAKDVVLPQNVIFKNQTLLNSNQASVTVVYSKDKRLENKYTDIYVKSDKNHLELKIGKELDELKSITINNQGEWYSLTNLFNERLPLCTFQNAELTTFVMQSSISAKLTFIALGGDMIYHINTGENELVNTFPVSKELEVTLF